MRQIFVDSRDRTSGTSSNFSMTLPQTLALESGHQGRIDDVRIPNSFPTVYPGNSGIRFRMGVTEYEVNLDYGQYSTGPELANEIRNKLQTTTGSWTVLYDARNTSMSISCSKPLRVHWRILHAATLSETSRLHWLCVLLLLGATPGP